MLGANGVILLSVSALIATAVAAASGGPSNDFGIAMGAFSGVDGTLAALGPNSGDLAAPPMLHSAKAEAGKPLASDRVLVGSTVSGLGPNGPSASELGRLGRQLVRLGAPVQVRQFASERAARGMDVHTAVAGSSSEGRARVYVEQHVPESTDRTASTHDWRVPVPCDAPTDGAGGGGTPSSWDDDAACWAGVRARSVTWKFGLPPSGDCAKAGNCPRRDSPPVIVEAFADAANAAGADLTGEAGALSNMLELPAVELASTLHAVLSAAGEGSARHAGDAAAALERLLGLSGWDSAARGAGMSGRDAANAGRLVVAQVRARLAPLPGPVRPGQEDLLADSDGVCWGDNGAPALLMDIGRPIPARPVKGLARVDALDLQFRGVLAMSGTMATPVAALAKALGADSKGLHAFMRDWAHDFVSHIQVGTSNGTPFVTVHLRGPGTRLRVLRALAAARREGVMSSWEVAASGDTSLV